MKVNDTKTSDSIHKEMLSIQQHLFDQLKLAYRVLDMHPGDLGAPASRKFDCEALLPGHLKDRQFYGEISSTSNCLDYQARYLSIFFCHIDREINHVQKQVQNMTQL